MEEITHILRVQSIFSDLTHPSNWTPNQETEPHQPSRRPLVVLHLSLRNFKFLLFIIYPGCSICQLTPHFLIV